MAGLAVDDGGDAVFGVAADAAPDLHDVAAGGIDDVAAEFLDFLHEGGGCAEGRDDDDIVGGEGFVFLAEVLPGEGDDAHFDELAIDFGVVDDFADEEDALIGEDAAGGVGEVDGAFDSIAEAELLGEADGGGAEGEFAAFFADAFDE